MTVKSQVLLGSVFRDAAAWVGVASCASICLREFSQMHALTGGLVPPLTGALAPSASVEPRSWGRACAGPSRPRAGGYVRLLSVRARLGGHGLSVRGRIEAPSAPFPAAERSLGGGCLSFAQFYHVEVGLRPCP